MPEDDGGMDDDEEEDDDDDDEDDDDAEGDEMDDDEDEDDDDAEDDNEDGEDEDQMVVDEPKPAARGGRQPAPKGASKPLTSIETSVKPRASHVVVPAPKAAPYDETSTAIMARNKVRFTLPYALYVNNICIPRLICRLRKRTSNSKRSRLPSAVRLVATMISRPILRRRTSD
jgi:hypothetical protein